MPDNQKEIKLLLYVLPEHVRKTLKTSPDLEKLIEVVMDLGKSPTARLSDNKELFLSEDAVTQEEIDFVVSRIGQFTSDNRSGIERTLHRISAIRNRLGKIVGLTCRVGRAVYGTIDVIRDVIESGKNTLFVGPPGIGKTTKLREAARVLADEFEKRVIVVDTSNEIAGDGDIPHAGIGKARRMQVATPELQHDVMIEAVENHMPEVIIVDEIGTEAEARACRTIAERGVQLIGTAHGVSLENLLSNPTLSDLVGGIQSVILGDEEAKRRRTQKAILERKAPPTFDVCIEIQEKDKFAIYPDVAKAIDKLLRGEIPKPEIRVRKEGGKVEVLQPAEKYMPEPTQDELEQAQLEKGGGVLKIFPFGVHRIQLERAIKAHGLLAQATDHIDEADLILTTKNKATPGSKIVKVAEERHLPLHVIRRNVSSQINKFLKYYFKIGGREISEQAALNEAHEAVEEVLRTGEPIDLTPQNAYVRRLQHVIAEKADLNSESIGEEPKRRLRLYP